MTCGGRDRLLRRESRAIGRRRRRVRHLQEARDAAADRGERLARDRRFVREPRLAAMDLTVDQPGQQVLARKVDDFRAGRHRPRPDPLDPVAANQHVGRDRPAVVDELRVDDRQHAHGLAPRPKKRSVAATSSGAIPGSNAVVPGVGTTRSRPRATRGAAPTRSRSDTPRRSGPARSRPGCRGCRSDVAQQLILVGRRIRGSRSSGTRCARTRARTSSPRDLRSALGFGHRSSSRPPRSPMRARPRAASAGSRPA